MPNRKYLFRSLGLAAATILVLSAPGQAQKWEPTEEVEIVSHGETTSSTWTNADFFARTANELGLFPHGVKVSIMAGARGAKARAYVANAHAGDPHKLQMLVPSQISNPILGQSHPNRDDFKPIAILLVTPKVFTVHADSPYQTFDDLIAAARERPGELIHGGGTLGSTSSMVSRVMEEYFDIDVTFTPFDDQGVIQLLGNHIDYIFAQPELVGKFVKAGDMRFLASSRKLEEFPDVPTLAELGYDFEVMDSYRGVWTSKDVPDEAIDYYVDAFRKIYESDQYAEWVRKNSMSPEFTTGEDLDAFLDGQIAVFTEIADEMKLIGK